MTAKKSAKKKAPKKARAKNEPPKRGDNAAQAERNRLINLAHKKIESFDDKITAIQDEKKAWKNENIKGKLGMKIADFDASHRLYKLDPDDRAIFLSTLHETFTAMGVGEQLDWLKAAERAEEIEEEEAEAAAQAAADEADPDKDNVVELPARTLN